MILFARPFTPIAGVVKSPVCRFLRMCSGSCANGIRSLDYSDVKWNLTVRLQRRPRLTSAVICHLIIRSIHSITCHGADTFRVNKTSISLMYGTITSTRFHVKCVIFLTGCGDLSSGILYICAVSHSAFNFTGRE